MYDGQGCVEIRRTAAPSLGTEMVGHGVEDMFEQRYRIATVREIAAPEPSIFTYIFIYIVPNIMFTQDSPSQCLKRCVLRLPL